jgi:hypothetical protein
MLDSNFQNFSLLVVKLDSGTATRSRRFFKDLFSTRFELDSSVHHYLATLPLYIASFCLPYSFCIPHFCLSCTLRNILRGREETVYCLLQRCATVLESTTLSDQPPQNQLLSISIGYFMFPAELSLLTRGKVFSLLYVERGGGCSYF